MKALVLLFGISLLFGCASQNVIVDTKGVDLSRYQQDRSECESYAGQVSTGTQVAKSAGFGAAVAAAVGAIFGNSRTVGQAAGAGGVVGGAKGAVKGENEKEQVLRNCLRGRGYRVLN
ncbi:MAG: glycine zipper family protein [Panacagrimonas sp.]